MLDMPRPRPPHLHRETTRHGSVVWYVRIGKGPRIRLRSPYGSQEFTREYVAAINGEAAPRPARGPLAGSVIWLVERYQETAQWRALKYSTRHKYELILKKVTAGEIGPTAAASILPEHIEAGMNNRAATPFQANNFLKAVRGLFQWALKAKHVERDPTAAVMPIKVKTQGFHAWSEEEIDTFEARWKVGTRERLAMALFLYSGLRRGDVAVLGRQHIRDGAIRIRTGKTDTELFLPILPELKRVIDATPTKGLALISSERTGRPMTKEGLGNWFSKACDAAGVPGSAHGLRKSGARRAAENGATQAQLKAIYGWSEDKTAAIYIRDADRARMAKSGMNKLQIARTKKKVRA